MDDRFLPSHHAPPRTPRWFVGADEDIAELIRISNRLRHRSTAVQRAATRASVTFRDVLRRHTRIGGK